MKEIYLDNNADQGRRAVFEEMRPYFTELYGNPSSMHYFGGQVQKKVTRRGEGAALLGADPSEIIFTACGTESDNTAIRSALESSPAGGTSSTTRVEHPQSSPRPAPGQARLPGHGAERGQCRPSGHERAEERH